MGEVRDNEIIKMMQALFNEQKDEIRQIQNNLNVQFDEVKKEIQEQGYICDKI